MNADEFSGPYLNVKLQADLFINYTVRENNKIPLQVQNDRRSLTSGMKSGMKPSKDLIHSITYHHPKPPPVTMMKDCICSL